MTEEKTKSGIEMIQDMHEWVATFERRLQNMEHLLKEMLSMMKSGSVPKEPQATPKADRPVAVKTVSSGPPKTKLSGNAKVFGRIKSDDNKGLPDVTVTIYDSRSQPIKRTKTNRAGDWVAFLPPGRYAAEYVLEGKVNENITFAVEKGKQTIGLKQVGGITAE